MPRKSQILLAAFLLLLTAGLIATRWQAAPAGSFELTTVQSAATGSEPDAGDEAADPRAPEAPAPEVPEGALDGAESGDAESVDAMVAMMAEVGSGFTYQGRVTFQGAPVDNTCDLRFSLWDALSSGTQVGATQDVNSVSVDEGLFTVTLNGGDQFGAQPFGGDERFLQMALRCPAGSGSFTALSPRQELTVGPYAQHAEESDTLEGNPALAFRRRLGNTCPPGSNKRTLNAGGTEICMRDPVAIADVPPPINQMTTLDDSANNVGAYTSVTIGADGLGLISYHDFSAGALKVARCQTVTCEPFYAALRR